MAVKHLHPLPSSLILPRKTMIRSSISRNSLLSSLLSVSTLTNHHCPFSSTSICNARNLRFFTLPIARAPISTGLVLNRLEFIPNRGGAARPVCSSPPSFTNLNSVERESGSQLLPATDDDHNGVIVEMQRPIEPQLFSSLLRSSVSHWTNLGKKGVWLKLPIELANLVDAAVKEGFHYHHAEPTYLMLALWIPETPSTLPANASHRVGVGAFVINDKKEVLAVQEKNGLLRRIGVWKFPTGVANEGEDISVAAAREVKEETGIDAKFVEVLTFRQSHNAFFQKSDLYFVCMLEPSSFDIKIQESEILAAKWMPFEEYAAQPFVQKHGLLSNVTKICAAKMEGKYTGFSSVPIKSTFRPETDCLFLSSESQNEQ